MVRLIVQSNKEVPILTRIILLLAVLAVTLGITASSASAHWVSKDNAVPVFQREIEKRCGSSIPFTWVCMKRETAANLKLSMRRAGSHSWEIPYFRFGYLEWLTGFGYVDAGNHYCLIKGRAYHTESPAAYFRESCS